MWLYYGVNDFIDKRNMTNYIEIKHPNVYNKVFDCKGLTPIFNSYKIIKFILSSDDYGDPMISIIRARRRSYQRLFVSLVVAVPILFYIYVL